MHSAITSIDTMTQILSLQIYAIGVRPRTSLNENDNQRVAARHGPLSVPRAKLSSYPQPDPRIHDYQASKRTISRSWYGGCCRRSSRCKTSPRQDTMLLPIIAFLGQCTSDKPDSMDPPYVSLQKAQRNSTTEPSIVTRTEMVK